MQAVCLGAVWIVGFLVALTSLCIIVTHVCLQLVQEEPEEDAMSKNLSDQIQDQEELACREKSIEKLKEKTNKSDIIAASPGIFAFAYVMSIVFFPDFNPVFGLFGDILGIDWNILGWITVLSGIIVPCLCLVLPYLSALIICWFRGNDISCIRQTSRLISVSGMCIFLVVLLICWLVSVLYFVFYVYMFAGGAGKASVVAGFAIVPFTLISVSVDYLIKIYGELKEIYPKKLCDCDDCQANDQSSAYNIFTERTSL